MARTDNQLIITNCYLIFKWAALFTILNDDEDENKIFNVMEQLAYGVHAEPDDEDVKYDKDDEDTSEYDESDGHDNIDNNEDPY